MSMQPELLTHIENEPLIVIRKAITDMLGGDVVASALFSYFEYWHKIKLAMVKKDIQENDVAEMHGEKRRPLTMYQFHTVTEIEDGIQIAKKDKIRVSLKLLIEKGIISIHDNPSPKFKFDKTKYYLFHTSTAQKLINDFRYAKKRTSCFTEVLGYEQSESAENTDVRKIDTHHPDTENKEEILSAENRTSLAENRLNNKITTETTEKEEKNKNKKEIPVFIDQTYLSSLTEDISIDHEDGRSYVMRTLSFLKSLNYEDIYRECHSEKSFARVHEMYRHTVQLMMGQKYDEELAEENRKDMEEGV